MTKAELIERIARARTLPTDITKKDIDRIVTLAFEEIAGYFARAKVTRSQSPRFSFPRFGTFSKKRRPARRGVHPRTLEPMQIDAFYSLDFRPSSELRDAMNGARVDEAATPKRARGRAPAAIEPKVGALRVGDDEVALETLADGDALPAAPMARVRAGAGSRARTG
ncbi:MAG TPA: HU family DNA-binding protein [Nannocystaceae bacterium]|nr:HU family DNA-binding protein [Nannocystaceae bacterium]